MCGIPFITFHTSMYIYTYIHITQTIILNNHFLSRRENLPIYSLFLFFSFPLFYSFFLGTRKMLNNIAQKTNNRFFILTGIVFVLILSIIISDIVSLELIWRNLQWSLVSFSATKLNIFYTGHVVWKFSRFLSHNSGV